MNDCFITVNLCLRGKHLSTQLRTIQDDTTKRVPSGSHYLVTMYVDMFGRGVGGGAGRVLGRCNAHYLQRRLLLLIKLMVFNNIFLLISLLRFALP